MPQLCTKQAFDKARDRYIDLLGRNEAPRYVIPEVNAEFLDLAERVHAFVPDPARSKLAVAKVPGELAAQLYACESLFPESFKAVFAGEVTAVDSPAGSSVEVVESVASAPAGPPPEVAAPDAAHIVDMPGMAMPAIAPPPVPLLPAAPHAPISPPRVQQNESESVLSPADRRWIMDSIKDALGSMTSALSFGPSRSGAAVVPKPPLQVQSNPSGAAAAPVAARAQRSVRVSESSSESSESSRGRGRKGRGGGRTSERRQRATTVSQIPPTPPPVLDWNALLAPERSEPTREAVGLAPLSLQDEIEDALLDPKGAAAKDVLMADAATLVAAGFGQQPLLDKYTQLFFDTVVSTAASPQTRELLKGLLRDIRWVLQYPMDPRAADIHRRREVSVWQVVWGAAEAAKMQALSHQHALLPERTIRARRLVKANPTAVTVDDGTSRALLLSDMGNSTAASGTARVGSGGGGSAAASAPKAPVSGERAGGA
jgi:hypothetical protein